ncbi:calpastatin-like isoform X5 [Megalops cyprinoides]|uniref:calpastatin-like isoform X5 n=1 Tax=Megalops cyprinoides TaxID=118141 RepID=UPI0018647380|nr:calpastatin-like isoform X5 [Megalops cyprinoides]
MGLIFSWFRGPKDHQALQDVTVEQQVKVEDTKSSTAVTTNKNVPDGKVEEKPEEVPTEPLSTDSALDSLSAGFTSSTAPCTQATLSSAYPPADKKTRMEEEASVPLDALSALSDTLGAPEPEPEPPKIRPEDIVTEGGLTSEEGVRVGEREDTLPPEYRFTEENGTDLPPPKEDEPPMDPAAALDALSGDFSSPAVVHTSVITPTAPANQPPMEALGMLSGDFDAPAVVPDVQTAIEPALLVEDIVGDENETDVKLKKTAMDDTSAYEAVSCDFGSAAVPVKALGEDASDMVPAQS